MGHEAGVKFFEEMISDLPLEEKIRLAKELIETKRQARQTCQIQFYEVANPDALAVHLATEKEVIIKGGNRSSKTDTNLADMVISMTKIIPFSLEGIYPQDKIQCPMRVRLMCESLTNTWEPVIKSKLQWNKWNGRGEPGGLYGHWGWIPPRFLLKGKWEESWSEKNRTLTLTCGCVLQIFSYDQDVEDLSGASVHRVINDEAPPEVMYRENKIRTMDTGGQIYTAFTPPDDPTKAMRAAWIYDLYDKGLDGIGKDSDIKSINLHTEKNRILDAESIAIIVKGLTPPQKETRLHGEFYHLTGRVHPLYTDVPKWWCFHCSDQAMIVGKECGQCKSSDVVEYCHFVEPMEFAYSWPVIYFLDPHPRKANMMCWIAVDPSDDYWMIGYMDVNGDPEMVRNKVEDFERDRHIHVAARQIDPRMAGSAAHNAGQREITVKDEYDAVGLRCANAVDNFDVGIKRLNDLLRPDRYTKSPRLKIFNNCDHPNRQLKRYVWSEWASGHTDAVKDPKQIAIEKENDYPRMLHYLANAMPTFAGLRQGNQPILGTKKKRARAY